MLFYTLEHSNHTEDRRLQGNDASAGNKASSKYEGKVRKHGEVQRLKKTPRGSVRIANTSVDFANFLLIDLRPLDRSNEKRNNQLKKLTAEIYRDIQVAFRGLRLLFKEKNFSSRYNIEVLVSEE